MIDHLSTLVVGGSFRRSGERLLVQKRSWEMLRIFTDHMADPLFAMHESPLDSTLEYELPRGVQVVKLPSESLGTCMVRATLNARITEEIRGVIDSGCVVYLRLPHWGCLRVFRYAMLKGNKVVASCHGDWVDGYRRKRGSLVTRLGAFFLSYCVKYILTKIANNSEILFCVGESLREQYGHFAKVSVVIANFLHSETDIHGPGNKSIAPPYRLLYVGGLEERKGLEYLIKSVRRLVDNGEDIVLTLIGAGPLSEKLSHLVNAEGLSERVDFIKYIQFGRELFKRYRSADVFVLPSISSEGTSKVIMEAMSQGVPVVATDVGSSRHLLENGKAGIVVPPRDDSQLADAIRTLIADDALRNKFIHEGLRLALQSTRDVQASEVKASLQSVIPEILGVPSYISEMKKGKPHI